MSTVSAGWVSQMSTGYVRAWVMGYKGCQHASGVMQGQGQPGAQGKGQFNDVKDVNGYGRYIYGMGYGLWVIVMGYGVKL